MLAALQQGSIEKLASNLATDEKVISIQLSCYREFVLFYFS